MGRNDMDMGGDMRYSSINIGWYMMWRLIRNFVWRHCGCHDDHPAVEGTTVLAAA